MNDHNPNGRGPGDTIDLTLHLEEMNGRVSESCDFCSTPEHSAAVRGRGVMEADYTLVNTYGAIMGHICHSCAQS